MPRSSRAVTSIDVARAAGVSQTTVSRVLNGHHAVSNDVRAQVESAIMRLGYRPNASARSLVTSRTLTAGVVLGDLTNSYYAELLHTISGQLRAAGYRTLILSDRAGEADDVATTLWESGVDGVIVTTTLIRPEVKARIVALGIPSVTLGPDVIEGVDALTPDNVAGGWLAADHLAGLGHRRIAVLAGPLDAASVRDRHRGFTVRLADDDITITKDFLANAELNYGKAYAASVAILRRSDRPTALFCHNDLSAFAALNAARALHLDVPNDVSVLGFDDVGMAAWESFRLTTVRQPIREQGVGAVEALLARIAKPESEPTRVTLPCTLVVRSTTAPV